MFKREHTDLVLLMIVATVAKESMVSLNSDPTLIRNSPKDKRPSPDLMVESSVQAALSPALLELSYWKKSRPSNAPREPQANDFCFI